MTSHSKHGWLYILCNDCRKRIDPEKAQMPFPGVYLCDDCTDDLFLNSTPVHQQPPMN